MPLNDLLICLLMLRDSRGEGDQVTQPNPPTDNWLLQDPDPSRRALQYQPHAAEPRSIREVDGVAAMDESGQPPSMLAVFGSTVPIC